MVIKEYLQNYSITTLAFLLINKDSEIRKLQKEISLLNVLLGIKERRENKGDKK